MRATSSDGVPASAGRRRAARLFAGPAGDPRARRATDAIALGLSALGLMILALVAVPPSGIEVALIAFVGALPAFLDGVWQILIDLLALVAVVLAVATVLRRRIAVGRDALLAALVALAVVMLLGRVVEGSWPPLIDGWRAGLRPWHFPAAHVAISGAVVLTVASHLSRPFRRPVVGLVWLAAFSSMPLGIATPSIALAGVLVATAAAAAVHLVVGSSSGRPGIDAVAAGLAELGVTTRSLGAADRQPAGVFLVEGADDDGPLLVKVYGRDAHDTQVLATLWRTLWYRETDAPPVLGRLHQVEHEALVTLLAAQAGVATESVVTAGTTGGSDALLVLRPAGRDISRLEPEEWTPQLLGTMWDVLGHLHGAGIVHGNVDAGHIFVTDGDGPEHAVGLDGFAGAAVGADPQRVRRDHAQLLATTLLGAGEEPAVDAARGALGDDGLADLLPVLQIPVLTAAQRDSFGSRGRRLDEVRERIAAALAIDPPQLEQLRRVSLGSLLQMVLLVFAFLAMARLVGGIDLAAVGDAIAGATWWLVAIGFVLGQVPRFAQAISTMGAAPVSLPLAPVYVLQLAVAYINLVIPGAAARIAVNVRFFQRQGLSRGASVAIGAVDGFGSLVIQVIVLGSLLLFGSASVDVDLDLDFTSGAGRLLVVIVGVAVGLGLVIALIPRLRRVVVTQVRQLLTEASSALQGLAEPRRLAMLFGGNLAADVLLALSLGAFVRSVGFNVSFGELIFIVIVVALLAGVLPIPGGIGVTEGGLVFGLTAAGVPEEIAFGAVMMYRIATFYLPPVWGFFAFRWLERNRYL